MAVKATIVLKNGFNISDYEFGIKTVDNTVLKPFQSGVEFIDVGSSINNYVARVKATSKEYFLPKGKTASSPSMIPNIPNPNAPCIIAFLEFKKFGTNTSGVSVGGRPYVIGSLTVTPSLGSSSGPGVGSPSPIIENENIAPLQQLQAEQSEQVDDAVNNPIQEIILEEL